jgi:hypothetical protein
LANTRSFWTRAQFDEQVEAISRIHTETIRPVAIRACPSKMN